jgi:hypothetical protein
MFTYYKLLVITTSVQTKNIFPENYEVLLFEKFYLK